MGHGEGDTQKLVHREAEMDRHAQRDGYTHTPTHPHGERLRERIRTLNPEVCGLSQTHG